MAVGPAFEHCVVLTAERLSKSFGTTVANDRVSLAIGTSEIVGLVGENGAGKSTLLSILAGFLRPDSGSLTVDGLPVTFASPADSLSAGIGLVHQHLSLVPSFTVSEQLALAGWSSASLPETLVADFRGDEIIEQLPMGRRQRVEIAKALVTNPKVLLLDEPTSILAPSEVGELFAILEALRSAGIAIVIVTHKLREVMTISGRIVVMADGKVTGAFERPDGDWAPGVGDEILHRMFAWGANDNAISHGAGRDAGQRHLPDKGDSPPMLRLSGVSAASRPGSRQLQGIGLDLDQGQIHAIVGIDGQGQTELAEVIAGYRRSDGTIELAGRDIQSLSSIERAWLGLGLLVDDRLGEAAIGSLSIAENLVLKRPRPRALARNGFFRRQRVVEHARSVIEAWGIEPSDPKARFGSLSGGNMQRLLSAREIERVPKVLIALNPVQGLDAVTADLLWSRLRGLCNGGSAVLVFTTDLDEALAQADRCAVIFDGRVSPLQQVDQVERSRFGAMMVNGW